jgi:hypothetical protein
LEISFNAAFDCQAQSFDHLTVSCAIEGHRKTIQHIMDLEGKIKSEKAPNKPHPPIFFDTTNVSNMPAPPGSKLGG